MDSINERFAELLKYKNISVKEASRMLSKSEAYIRKLLRPGESFGIDPVYCILNGIPDVSAEWLLNGTGNMLKDSPSNGDAKKESDLKRKDEAIPDAIRTNETASILIDEVPIIDSITDIKVLQFITKLCYNYFDKINTIQRLEEQIRQMHGYISKLKEQAGAVGQDSNKETQETGTDEAKLYHDETRYEDKR